MAKTPRIVFYSWQSDLPNSTNRGFIEEALKKAVKTIQNDDSIDASLIIDRDTKGVPGSPDIAKTIFGKIEQADIFVCDISIINLGAVKQVGGRPTPNPNVLIELGYALRALGEDHIIMLLNESYGERKLLPFDLYTHRASDYKMPFETNERATERNRLAGELADAFRTILEHLDKPLPGELIEPMTLAEQAQIAIKAGQVTEQKSLVREYMDELANSITALTPAFDLNDSNQQIEQLKQAIKETTAKVVEFAQLAKRISQSEAIDAAQVMYRGFGNILDLYTHHHDSMRNPCEYAHDLARFLGHELFVSCFSFLMREERWELIADLLDKDLLVRNRNLGPRSHMPFGLISTGIHAPQSHPTLHCDLLADRHRNGDLAKLVPFEQFVEADYFLCLRTLLQLDMVASSTEWTPWSFPLMKEIPRFLQTAQFNEEAQRLLRPLGVEDIATLRQVKQRTKLVFQAFLTSFSPAGYWLRSHPMNEFDFDSIGSR